MSDNNDFISDIDDILAEFSSFSNEFLTHEQSPAPDTVPAEPASPSAEEVFEAKPYVPKHQADHMREERPRVPETTVMQPYVPKTPAVSHAPSAPAPVQRRRNPVNNHAAPASQHRGTRRPVSPVIEAQSKALYPEADAPRRSAADKFSAEMLGYSENKSGAKAQPSHPRRQSAAAENAPRPRRTASSENMPHRRAEKDVKAPAVNEKRGLFSSIALFMVVSVFALSWVFLNVHPDSGTISSSTVRSKMNIIEKLDNFVNNTASNSLDGLVYIPKIYTIPEEATVAPKPNPASFGSTTDPNEVMKIIESAANLLDGQELVFNPEADFVPGSPIQYYLDDTILAITWQEDINNKLCSCSEVKLAHGSQLRRKLADDSFNSGRQYYASDMAKQCNAIVAINGDFYANRTIGLVAYNRELYRFTANDRLDSCSFTSSGDMLFSHAGELYDEAYTRQFIEENDVVFTISFGPILIENGELKDLSGGYPIGEINQSYSRTGMAQMGHLHYFTMNINYGTGGNGKGYGKAATLAELGQYMYDKGCPNAYTLDGGQTSVLLMNGELVNHVDFGNERLMSDIIYFATAIPEEEAAQ